MKTAIVTGASGGIGKEISKNFVSKGFKVYKISSSNCDIRKPDAIKLFFDKIEHVDVLVNCAGRSHLGRIEDLKEGVLNDVYTVNVLGTVRLCQAVLPIMKRQHSGYIINVGSLRGIKSSPGKAAYSMSKAAVITFSKILGLEVKKYGIKVTCINPGFVYTDLIKHRIHAEGIKPEDIVQPLDIARTISYLLDLSPGVYLPEINLGEVWE